MYKKIIINVSLALVILLGGVFITVQENSDVPINEIPNTALISASENANLSTEEIFGEEKDVMYFPNGLTTVYIPGESFTLYNEEEDIEVETVAHYIVNPETNEIWNCLEPEEIIAEEVEGENEFAKLSS